MDWSIILSSCIVAGTTILSIFIKELVQSKNNKKQACVVRYTKKNENVQKAVDLLETRHKQTEHMFLSFITEILFIAEIINKNLAAHTNP